MNRIKSLSVLLERKRPVQNAHEVYVKQMTQGERASDWIAVKMGSWKFIITQSILLVIWVILNVTAYMNHWDPYPFILMNLAMSLQAAFTAPIIMMSQNRQSEKDRIEAHNDYEVNKKTGEEVRAIMMTLEVQDKVLLDLQTLVQSMHKNQTAS